ncbi:hypothetical protein VNO78_25068 [Psophocarpus tetragonolobus]|uniref:Uncharacterized protein n=1 Tax=Psophocarpus tetragonolobus TaxID=3891 RepID=A0AAN9XEY4_PSOTE
MANPIPIRAWPRLASLRSNPESNPKPQLAEHDLKTTNTSSNDNKESATKSVPKTPDVQSPIQSQKLKLTTPITFPPSKLKAQPPLEINKGNGIGQNGKEVTSKENKMKEKGIRVITISGENKGAYMHITKSQKKLFHKMRGMYGNSNVQCVNNSMVFNTSLTHHDPGVHPIIPKNPFGHLKERVDGQRN